MSLARLDAIATALERLPDLLTAAVPDIVRDNTFLLELDNQQQLEAGLDANDRPITPAYAPLTRLLKQEQGLDPNTVTLHDRGDFYASIVAEVRGGAIEMEATDPKTAELTEKYGDAILGLSTEAVDAFREEVVKPELQEVVHKAFGL